MYHRKLAEMQTVLLFGNTWVCYFLGLLAPVESCKCQQKVQAGGDGKKTNTTALDQNVGYRFCKGDDILTRKQIFHQVSQPAKPKII